MAFNRRYILIAFIVAIVAIVGFLAVRVVQEGAVFVNMLRPFTVTIHNESDHELTGITAGIYKGGATGEAAAGEVDAGSVDFYNHSIKAGKRAKFSPKLKHIGEGSIYLEYTDANGLTTRTTVCSYTESVTGNARLTITNTGATVEEDCW